MSVESWRHYLPEYLAGTLDEELRAEVERWLASDPAARRELEELDRIRESCRHLRAPEPPESVRESFLAALEEEQLALAPAERSTRKRSAGRGGPWSLSWGRALRAAALLAVGLFLGAVWAGRPTGERDDRLAFVAAEVETLKQQVLLSQLNHPAATERIRGVRYGLEMAELSGEARSTLERVMLEDANTHVRMAAAQVLFHFMDRPATRRRLAELASAQTDPTVQLQMVGRLNRSDPALGEELIRSLEASDRTDPKVQRYLQELI